MKTRMPYSSVVTWKKIFKWSEARLKHVEMSVVFFLSRDIPLRFFSSEQNISAPIRRIFLILEKAQIRVDYQIPIFWPLICFGDLLATNEIFPIFEGHGYTFESRLYNKLGNACSCTHR